MWGEINQFICLGFFHIADWAGRDHLFFLLVLAGNYSWLRWHTWLPVITAFTIAHSITLILSVYDVIRLPQAITEIAIAGTIFFTALENVFEHQVINRTLGAGVFGLIHGLGFSGILREIFGLHGKQVLLPLLSFNVGLEIGQVAILIVIWITMYLIIKLLAGKISKKDAFRYISGMVLLQAGYWIIERSTEL